MHNQQTNRETHTRVNAFHVYNVTYAKDHAGMKAIRAAKVTIETSNPPRAKRGTRFDVWVRLCTKPDPLPANYVGVKKAPVFICMRQVR